MYQWEKDALDKMLVIGFCFLAVVWCWLLL